MWMTLSMSVLTIRWNLGSLDASCISFWVLTLGKVPPKLLVVRDRDIPQLLSQFRLSPFM